MSEKMKLNLEDLKVQSFVTTLQKNESDKFKGGAEYTDMTCEHTCRLEPASVCPGDSTGDIGDSEGSCTGAFTLNDGTCIVQSCDPQYPIP